MKSSRVNQDLRMFLDRVINLLDKNSEIPSQLADQAMELFCDVFAQNENSMVSESNLAALNICLVVNRHKNRVLPHNFWVDIQNNISLALRGFQCVVDTVAI